MDHDLSRAPAVEATPTTSGPSADSVLQQKAAAISRKRQSGEVNAALQMAGSAAAATHQIAAEGISGSGGALPHLDTIQQSFGRHDVSHVQAHVGGAAATANEQMGSLAYATGDHIAFKGTPDLHTAAHEAAHTVQQQKGVALKDGIGRVGDPYERHADAVADRVVQGRSAEDLLDAGPGGGGGGSVQYIQFDGLNHRGQPIQFDTDPTGSGSPAAANSTAGSGGTQVSGEAGEFTQVQLSGRIPTPITGLTINVTLTGKYTTGTGGGHSFIEAEGVARVALTYSLLFLDLSVFGEGSLKFKVQDTQDWQAAFNAAFEDISHWFAARELANLPAKKQQVNAQYNEFKTAVRGQISSVRGQSETDRHSQLSRESRPLLGWNSALANIVDARNDLVEDVRGIFEDMNGSIRGNAVFPGTSWMQQQMAPHLADGRVTATELSAIRNILINEANRKATSATSQMDHIPAISNNPNVEFEGNLRVGFEAGISITDNTSANIELSRGWRISDGMGDTQFNTGVSNVYTAAIGVSGKIRGVDCSGQLAYEGVGGEMTSPQEFKITGQVSAGLGGSEEDPEAHRTTLSALRSRLGRAWSGASANGQSALSAVATSIKREMGNNQAAQWSYGASRSGVLSVEVAWQKNADGSYSHKAGKVQFAIVTAVSGSLGVLSGSVERGHYISVSWTPG